MLFLDLKVDKDLNDSLLNPDQITQAILSIYFLIIKAGASCCLGSVDAIVNNSQSLTISPRKDYFYSHISAKTLFFGL